MHKIIQFWQRDGINKLIVLVLLLILLAAGAQVYLLTATPQGQAFVAGFFPTPTMSVNEIFQAGLATTTAAAQQTAAAVAPTITTMPFTIAPTITASLTEVEQTGAGQTETPTAALPTHTATPSPGPTASATPAPGTTALPVSAGDCPPPGTPQPAKVAEIIDGNTARVMIGELMYTVRYLGVELPRDENYARLATARNGQLVYGKEVVLIGDSVNRDDRNRLLRYVLVNDQHVNLALIREGLGEASTGETSYLCRDAFLAAEQEARSGQAGMWKPPAP